MGTRRRCTECRRTFHPSPRASATARVCGPACRAARDRKLARARRRSDVDAYRADERTRQQDSRARRANAKAAATTPDGPRHAEGHAPPSVPKRLELPRDLVAIVDHALARSRATLLRDLLQKQPPERASVVTPWPASRGSFGAQSCDPTGKSGAILGACHA